MGIIFKYSPLIILICFLFYVSFIWLHSFPQKTPFTEIPAEIVDLVDKSYEKMTRDQLEKKVIIDVLGSERCVLVTDSFRGADYGFIKINNNFSHIFIMSPGKYEIFKYNTSCLFVVLEKKYSLSLHECK